MKKIFLAILFAVFSLFSWGFQAEANALIWNNGAANMQWNTTSANWTGSVWSNINPDSATFGATGVGTISLTTPITVGVAGLTFNTAGYSITSNTLTLSGTPTITTTATATISSILAGTGFNKTGTGALILSGANTYNGVTTINLGTLQANNATALGSSGNISFGGGALQYTSASKGVNYGSRIKSSSAIKLDFNGQSITTLTGIDNTNTSGLNLYNSGAVTSNGGTVAMSATNSYTGGTIVGDKVRVNLTNNSGFSSGEVTINGGGQVYLNTGVTNITNSFTLNGAGWVGDTYALGAIRMNDGTIIGNSSIITLATASNIYVDIARTATIDGKITGSGNLTVNASSSGGTLVFTNPNNDYSGNTTVSGGVLTISGAGSINPVTGAGLNIGANGNIGNFQYNSTATSTFAAINVGNNSNSPGTLTQTGGVINASSLALSTVYSDNTGTLNLSGGVMSIAGSANIGQRVSVAGASLANLNISSTGILQVGGGLNIGFDPTDTRHGTGIVTQSGGTVTAVGGLVLTSAAASTFTRTATYNLDGGVLNVNQISQTANGGGTQTGTFNFNGGVLKSTTDNPGFMQGLTTANVKSGGAKIETDYNITIGQNLLVSTGGGLTKTGTGALTLSGTNTYTGTTTISAGTLIANSTTTLGSNVAGTNINGGTLDINGQYLGTESLVVSGSGVSSLGAIVNNGVDWIYAIGRITLAGPSTIGGTGRWDLRNSIPTMNMSGYTLTKEGSNYVALVGATVSNPGNIVINNGTFAIQTSSNMNGSSANNISIASGGTLGFWGNTLPITWSVTSNAGTILQESGSAIVSGSITLNSGFTTIDVPGTLLTASTSIISGLGGIIKTGTGELNLNLYSTVSPQVSNFSGGAKILAGTLKLSNTLGAGGQVVTPGGDAAGIYYLGDTSGSLAATLAIANNNITFNNPIVVQAGSSGNKTLYSSGGSGTSASLGSSVLLNDNLILNTAAAGTTLSLNGQITNGSNGAKGLNITGSGVVYLKGTNTYTGTTTILGGGTLRIGNGGTNGSISTSSLVVIASGSLTIDRSDTVDFSNTITGTNGFIKEGTGMTILSAANSFAGNVTLNAGTLKLTNSNSLGVGTKFFNMLGGSRILHLSNSITLGSNITMNLQTNSGDGLGVVSLDGVNEIQSKMYFNAGAVNYSSNAGSTLILSGDIMLKNTALANLVVILGGASTSTNTISGVIGTENATYSLSVQKQGAGTWTLSNTNTYTGTTTVNSGILNFTTAVPASNNWRISHTSFSAYAQLTLPPSPDLTGKVVNIQSIASDFGYTKTLVSWTGTATGSPTLQLNGVTVTSDVYVGDTKITYSATSGITITRAPAVTVPTSPISLTATSNENTVSNLSWITPSSDGGSPILSYYITNNLGISTTTISAPATNATISDLTNGSSYTFSIVAVNAVGTSTATTSNTVIPATVPSAPQNVIANSNEDSRSSILWSAPASTGGSPILYYTVTSNPENISTTTTSTTAIITGLTNGTSYTFDVTAVNAIGTSTVATSNTVTPATITDAPTSPSTVRGNQEVTVSWNPPTVITSPIIQYNIYNQVSNTVIATTSDTVLTNTFSGLTNGTTYYYYVTAVNGVGESASSSVVSGIPAATPSAPGSLGTTFGNQSISLTWTASTANGSSISQYNIYNASTSGLLATTTSTNFDFTSLTNGNTYSYYVTAVNGVGESASSSIVSEVPRTLPSTPTITSVTSSSGRANIFYSASSDNGSVITAYTVTSNPGNISVSGLTNPLIITGLTNGTSYTFTMTATNAIGTSASSSPSSAVSPHSSRRIIIPQTPVVTTPEPIIDSAPVIVTGGSGSITPTTTPIIIEPTVVAGGQATATPVTNANYQPTVCTPYLTGYIKQGSKNNPEDVKKLQIFLNTYEGTTLVVDGVYKTVDVNAVKAFQIKNRKDVLDFWNMKNPSGYVYISTQKAINRVYCEHTKELKCPYFNPTTARTNPAPAEVIKIRKFLNETQNENISTTNLAFDTELVNAVKRYQAKYSNKILKPWNLTKPTGLWYQSTRKYADEQLGCFYPTRLDNGVVVE